MAFRKPVFDAKHIGFLAVGAALILAGCLVSGNAPGNPAVDPGKTDTTIGKTDPKDTATKKDTGKVVTPVDTTKADTTKIKKDTVLVKSGRVRPELIRGDALLANGLLKAAGSGSRKAGATSGEGPHWSSAVRLAGFKTPVTGITLQDSTGAHGAVIYTCHGGDCLVDLAGSSVEDLLRASGADIAPGIYSYVQFGYCAEGASGYRAQVTAEVTLNDTVYYTHAGGSLSKSGPATAAEIAYSGCSRLFALPHPVEISATTDSAGKSATAPEIRLRLFFDAENLVWAGLHEHATAPAWAPGNCAGPNPDASPADSTPYLCAGYPDVAGTTDSAAPKLERYYVNESAVFGLFFSAVDGDFLGGYSRRYLREGDARAPGFEPSAPVRDFNQAFGGLCHIELFGGGIHGEGSIFETDDFRREAHWGVWTNSQGAIGSYDVTVNKP